TRLVVTVCSENRGTSLRCLDGHRKAYQRVPYAVRRLDVHNVAYAPARHRNLYTRNYNRQSAERDLCFPDAYRNLGYTGFRQQCGGCYRWQKKDLARGAFPKWFCLPYRLICIPCCLHSQRSLRSSRFVAQWPPDRSENIGV